MTHIINCLYLVFVYIYTRDVIAIL